MSYRRSTRRVPEGGSKTNWNLQSAANAVVAATPDGLTLRLYARNLTDNAPAYALLGSLDISSSVNPAITTRDGDGTHWDAGVFTVGRGLPMASIGCRCARKMPFARSA